jgi:predicted DCC family thiol-disulfide oxidoreductase YuxK
VFQSDGGLVMYYLLFDSECLHCSEVAHYIRNLGIPNLRTRSLHDPQVGDLLPRGGLERRAQRPLLLRDEDGRISVQAGVRMRVSLFRLLGLRRSITVMHLAKAAQRGRRHASGHEVTRRRTLQWITGGIAAGAVTAIFGPRAAMAAERSKLSNQDVAALRAAPAVMTATATFGAPDWEKTAWYGRGRNRVAAIVHSSSDIVTYASDPALSATVIAVALRTKQTDSQSSLAWFEVNGAAIGTQTSTGQGTLRTVSVTGKTIETDRSGRQISESASPEEPELCWPSCFISCVGHDVAINCEMECSGCAAGSKPDCVACGVCAGIHGVSCARKCYAQCHGNA